MKVCIIIPVYNEARMIGKIVEEIKARSWDVIVVNDGSTDLSGGIAKEKGAFVIDHREKQGKGVSLRDGFSCALSQGFDGVIAMDGDGQHHIDDIESFMVKARQYPDSIISGNRMLDCKHMPLIRRFVNRMMSLMISSICHQSIPDSQCGFRFISASILRSIVLTSSNFEIETEIFIKASRKGFKIHSIPVQTIYRDELSKINPFVDTFRFFRYILKELIGSRSST
ncbi:MAG: glycosyltransferase family 2 protein [Candidatus Omnitrophota bacterium]